MLQNGNLSKDEGSPVVTPRYWSLVQEKVMNCCYDNNIGNLPRRARSVEFQWKIGESKSDCIRR